MRKFVFALIISLLVTGVSIAAELPMPAVPEVTLKPAKTTPVIDGRLDDACWNSSAVRLTGFTYNRLPMRKAIPQTVVFVTYDRNNLYLGFKCYEQLMEDIVANVTLPDGQTWAEDSVDIAIDPQGTGKGLYQFAINANGVVYSCGLGGSAPRDFVSKGTRAAASKNKDCWTVEAAIPWKDFPISPNVSSTWRMNFCRNRMAGDGGLSAWSFVNGGFHAPDRLGYFHGINVDFSGFAAPQLMSTIRRIRMECSGFSGDDRSIPRVRAYLSSLESLQTAVERLGKSPGAKGFSSNWRDLLRRMSSAEQELFAVKECILVDHARRCAVAKIGEKAVYGVCVTPSAIRIIKDQSFPGKFGVPARIELARNETESTQLVLIPFAGDLKDVKVSVSPVTNGKAELSAEVNVIGYVKHDLKDSVSYGDVMLTNSAFDVADNTNQAVLISVRTGMDTAAGDYSGTINIRPANAHSYDIPLKVQVWDFALSNKPTIDAWFGANHACTDWLNSRHVPNALVGRTLPLPSDPNEFESRKEALRKDIDSLTAQGYLSLNFEPNAELNGQTIYWHGDAGTDPYYYGPAEEKALKEWFRAFGRTMEEIGAADRMWLWIWDEPSAHHYNAMIQKCEIVRHGSEKIGRVLVGGGMPKRLAYQINMWCPLISGFSEEFAKQAEARGNRVWWYTCCEPPHPFANIAFIDHPLTESRIIPWMMYKYKVGGFLYWNTDLLVQNTSLPYAEHLPSTDCGAIGSGDGILWYKSVPSCRLNCLAEGYEDHQYLTILSIQAARLKSLASKWNGAARAKLLRAATKSSRLCDIPASLIKDLAHYTSDPDLMLARRRTVANQIVSNRKLLNTK